MARIHTPLIVANWKMNGLLLQSMQFIKELRQKIIDDLIGCQIVICPPFTLLRDMVEKIPGTGIMLGGQDCHHKADGAFTGEVSAAMLSDMKCDYVILGHSERRQHHNEGSELVQKKAASAISNGLKTVICVGETEFERDNGIAEEVIKQQLTHSIPETATPENVVIAYEPVWAIGTNRIPTTEQIQEMHHYINRTVSARISSFAEGIRVIYGGSVSAENAPDILSVDHVDGLLVGRASLEIDSFWKIITAASAV